MAAAILDLRKGISRFVEKPFVDQMLRPWGWLAFRVSVGLFLVIEGWPRIQDPLGHNDMIASLGLQPAWLVSPLQAALLFIGGIMIMLGLMTRPVAIANAVVLLLSYYYYFTDPFGGTLISPEGLSYLRQNAELLTPAGRECLLEDGGAAFVQMFHRATGHASIFLTAAVALVGLFGGGQMSLDHAISDRHPADHDPLP